MSCWRRPVVSKLASCSLSRSTSVVRAAGSTRVLSGLAREDRRGCLAANVAIAVVIGLSW